MLDVPRYRMLLGDEARGAVPAASFRLSVAKLMAWHAGRARLFPNLFEKAWRRLDRDPRATSLRLEFAEGYFGHNLVIEIDPARLDAMLVDLVADGDRTFRLAQWFLDAGDWSGAVLPLAQSEVERDISAIFDPAGIQASSAYAHLTAQMASGVPAVRNGVVLSSPALIDAYFSYYRDLRESIERCGFQRRRDLAQTTARPFRRSPVRGRGSEEREREIGVAVGPDGRLLRIVGGHHRTAIAQRLRLPRIPVQVRLIHVDWLREQVSSRGTDLRDALIAGVRSLGRG